MRAAVLKQYGTPVYDEFEPPRAGDGNVVVKVLAAGVNPVDIAIAAGTFMRLQLPCVAGREGIGLIDNRRVYFNGAVPPYGSMAEYTLIDPSAAFDVPDTVDDASALALGIAGLTAWLSLTWRAKLEQGEHVLILGASGMVGMIAVQVARLLGAGRIVAAARSESRLAEAKENGADATVQLAQSEDALITAFREASAGRLDVIIDPVWGVPARAAMRAATKNGRLVQIGSSAAPDVSLNPGFMRGPLLSILGFSSGSVPRETSAEAYEELCRLLHAGALKLDTQTLPLASVEEAWAKQKSSPHHKIVLKP